MDYIDFTLHVGLMNNRQECEAHARGSEKVVVLYNSADPDSSTLGRGFSHNKGRLRPFVEAEQPYNVGKPDDDLSSNLKNLLLQYPDTDMIYFAGYANGVQQILNTLQKTPALKKFSHLPIMGGNALSVLSNYPNANDLPGKGQLYFTSFAFYQKINQRSPRALTFLNDYQELFDPSHQHSAEIGPGLPDGDAILANDAMQVLLDASQRWLAKGKKDTLWDELCTTNIQGLSGPIQFDPTDHSPVNKPVLILRVDASGKPVPV